MYKTIIALLFSLMIGFTGSTYSADSKPVSPIKFCTLQADVQFNIANARSINPPAEIAEMMWVMFDNKKISLLQLATSLTWVIEIYSSSLPAEEIKTQAYNNCMTVLGQKQV